MSNSRVQRLLFIAAVLWMGSVAGRPAAAITTTRVASGLARPIYVTAPDGDDRLFIIEQRGIIRILKDGAVLGTPFLDVDALIPNISGNDERGLLGLTFHPDYAQNGQFYLNYINLSNDTVIARYLVSEGNPDVADPTSGQIIMTIDQPDLNHNGGTLLFSPIDGYLYIGMGDGGGAGDQNNYAQSDNILLGKMLRIDVDNGSPYAIPSDNPFGGPGLPLDEIWSKGWRNPYRWSFDRLTGDIYVGDVGQGLWEEISFEESDNPGGGNYGWRRMEGNHCYNPSQDCDDGTLIHPIFEYSQAGARCAVIGGHVYRGDAIPTFQGVYFFADFCSDEIWSFRYSGGTLTEFTDRTAEFAPGGGLSITDISAIGQDGHGELYIVDRGTGTNGEIYKIIQSPADAPSGLPAAGGFGLGPVVPNPSRGQAAFRVALARTGVVEIEILDASGRIVRALGSRNLPAGSHQIDWNGQDDAGRILPSGVYFVRATVDGSRMSQRLQLVR